MAEWRIGRGWSDAELAKHLVRLDGLERNFPEDHGETSGPQHGWHRYRSEARVGTEPIGPPLANGPFQRGRVALDRYAFSDPSIVIAHFRRDAPLHGRRMLLEVKVMGVHYLGGVLVSAVHDAERDGFTSWGFRYDTLEGHLEAGFEWFLLVKDHGTGDIRFRIQARWRRGDLPNWWSRLGFPVLVRLYQDRWHRRAHARMRDLMREPHGMPRRIGGLAHRGPAVTFTRKGNGDAWWRHDEWKR